MTDQTIPADKVREIVEKMHHHANDPYVGSHEKRNILIFAQQFAALLPPPKRPTLADMADKERAACQWMQADVDGEITAGIIAKINPADAHLIASDGETWFLEFDTVTPRPDLPRLEWPGTHPRPEDATLAKVGTMIESADDPRVAALPDGTILVDRDDDAVIKWGGEWSGAGYIPNESQGSKFGPWKVIHAGKEDDQ